MSSGLVDLLGKKLQLKDDTVDTATISNESKAVALYFSAHWCPPCRGFTPKLVDWYKKFKESDRAKEMEMVFVSSDRDEGSFKEYYGEMPFHALPFSDRDRKAVLSKKFKVQGIPTLLVLDAKSGDVICKNARGKIEDDADGIDFPWHPKPLSDMLKGPILTKDGEKDISELCKDKVVGIYFSAHWCPPCRGFTPDLIKSYQKIKADGKDFEMIFVSWDKDEEKFEEYFKEMPWTAFPHEDPRAKQLAGHFEVDGIPSLVMIDKDHKTVINESARGAVTADPDGKEFPWWPKPANELASMAAGLINTAAALIYLTGDDSEDKEKEAESLIKPIAEKYFEERKTNSKMEEINFFYECSKSDDLPDSLRGFAKLGNDSPLLFILNIPDQQKYIHKSDAITAAEIEDVVSKFKSNTLDFKPVQG